jgi:hypothetical protein
VEVVLQQLKEVKHLPQKMLKEEKVLQQMTPKQRD